MNAKPGIFTALSRDQSRAELIPTIPTVPPAVVAPGIREQKRYVVTLTDGGIIPISVSGDFVYVENVTNSTSGYILSAGLTNAVTLKSDTGNVSLPVLSIGQAMRFPSAFTKIEVNNPTGNGAIQLTIWIGFGAYEPPIVRTGPLTFSFTSAAPFIGVAAAYAVGDAVGSGPNSIDNFFPLGFTRAKIIRARILSSNTLVTTNANFRLWLTSDNNTVYPTYTDHTAGQFIMDTYGTQSPIEFPTFIAATQYIGLPRILCDLAGINVPLTRGIYSGKLYWQLEALSAYTSVLNQIFTLAITAEFS